MLYEVITLCRGRTPLLPPGSEGLSAQAAALAKASAFKGEAGQVALFPLHGEARARQLVLRITSYNVCYTKLLRCRPCKQSISRISSFASRISWTSSVLFPVWKS